MQWGAARGAAPRAAQGIGISTVSLEASWGHPMVLLGPPGACWRLLKSAEACWGLLELAGAYWCQWLGMLNHGDLAEGGSITGYWNL